MPETGYARRVALAVSIDGHDAAGDFAPCLLDFTYTDNASGKADEVQSTLHDRDGRFSGEWLPKKGMEIEAAIICSDWESPGEISELPCGKFRIDELDFTGPPDKIAIKAVSSDLSGPLRDEKKTRAWENMNLEGVAGQIAQENGLALYYSGPNHRFDRQDQRNEGDIAFLNRLCGERSMNFKVHDGKIALFDADEAEKAEPVLVVPKSGDMFSPASYSFKISSSGTDYTDCEVAYADPKTGVTHKAKIESKKETRSADGRKKTLTVQKRAESAKDAATLGKSELHAANVKERSASVEIMGCPFLAAGQMVELSDFGEFSGEYFIKTATHKVSGAGKYTTRLELETPAPTEIQGAFDEKSEAAISAREEIEILAIQRRNEPLDRQAEKGLEELLNRLPAIIGAANELIFCLPAILDAEAERARKSGDAEKEKGMLILKQALIRWLGNAAIKGPANNPDTLWVDWKWLLSEEKAKTAYEFVKNNILSKAARDLIVKKLSERKLFTQKTEYFNFITDNPKNWKAERTQSCRVESNYWERFQMKNAHVAVLGDYMFYGLVNGYVEPITDKNFTHRIYITRAAVVMRDSFDFEGWQLLGIWDCENLKYRGWTWDPTVANSLYNQDFERLRETYGNGADFYLAAPPKDVAIPRGYYYDVTI